ncbi:hypothetical protein [Priestia flexa]|uniref:hypothetical protein n=1 Tax=Priestia flexa TaxID=86664 RepID=UPI00248F6246|nr:hypothetical protein [Priestia flexa]
MEWRERHSTPPRGKRVAVAQWNERVQANQREGSGYCLSLRSSQFVISQTLAYA